MDVSIVIVTWNTRAQTCAAIDSILQSQDRLEKEIILVDNGSTDDTPDFIRKNYSSVCYLRSEKNLGFGRANNWGAKSSHGRYVLLLNSDARLQADSLKTSVEYMDQHLDCGIAGAQLLNTDGSMQNSIANFPTLATELLNKSLLRRLFPKKYPGKEQHYTKPVPVETVIGAFMLIRREVWDAIGGFDERYFFFFEETDLCLQVRRKGLQILHLPQVRVWHDQGQTAKMVRAASRIEYWRSRYLYFDKNHSSSTRFILRIGLLMRLCMDALGAAVAAGATMGHKPKQLNKWQVSKALLIWHWRGKPEAMGLPR